MLVFISNWITFVRETFHQNTLVRHFFIITDTYVTNIQNNKNTVMTEKEKEAVRLPENAFRELKDGGGIPSCDESAKAIPGGERMVCDMGNTHGDSILGSSGISGTARRTGV